MTIPGVDYSFNHPTAGQLAAAGKRFAVRYVYPHSQGPGTKNLTRGEAAALAAKNIDIVSNFESWAGRGDDGYAAGRADAQTADVQHRECGGPPGRPIYFSVDFDTTRGDWPKIDAYFRGVASVIGLARTGVYGEYDLVQHLINNALIGKSSSAGKWFAWQTYAWSGGRYDERCTLAQDKNGVKLGAGTVDLDTAHAPDYGQWGYATPTPAAKKKPARKAAAKRPPAKAARSVQVAAIGSSSLRLWSSGRLTVHKDGAHLYTVTRDKK